VSTVAAQSPATMRADAAPVRLGRVDFVNVLPVFMGLDELGTRCHLVRGVPTALNARLRARTIDCAPVSAVELAHAHGAYAMLPGLSVSSVGAVGSSLLFSRVPPERLDGASVALTTDSAASLAFFRILCARRWHITVRAVDAAPDLDAMLAAHDGCVLIGNRAIVAAEVARRRGDLVISDLGEAWLELTGLPAVFAVFALWRDWAAANPDALALLREDLQRGRDWGADPAHHRAMCRRAAAETGLGVPAMEAYLARQDYRLADEHIRSLERYFAELHALGLAPSPPALQFAT